MKTNESAKMRKGRKSTECHCTCEEMLVIGQLLERCQFFIRHKVHLLDDLGTEVYGLRQLEEVKDKISCARRDLAEARGYAWEEACKLPRQGGRHNDHYFGKTKLC